jgi:hypothetical protein
MSKKDKEPKSETVKERIQHFIHGDDKPAVVEENHAELVNQVDAPAAAEEFLESKESPKENAESVPEEKPVERAQIPAKFHKFL